MSDSFLVYHSPFCPYCTMAFRLLDQLGFQYESISLIEHPEKRKEMEVRSNRTSVPQIFFGETHIGGYDDMFAMNQEGKLTELVNKKVTI